MAKWTIVARRGEEAGISDRVSTYRYIDRTDARSNFPARPWRWRGRKKTAATKISRKFYCHRYDEIYSEWLLSSTWPLRKLHARDRLPALVIVLVPIALCPTVSVILGRAIDHCPAMKFYNRQSFARPENITATMERYLYIYRCTCIQHVSV